MINHITIIGAGNVATHLAQGFFNKGLKIDAILSRNYDTANRLAEKVRAKTCIELSELPAGSDLYLLCVPDDVIGTIAGKLPDYIRKNSIIAHTSGSTPSLTSLDQNYVTGVFYPLQTFSKSRSIDLENVPLFITTSDKKTKKVLTELAETMSESVSIIDDESRLHLHIAAVFANNFSNHLFTIANNLLKQKNISFDHIRPLISETARKVMLMIPENAQTGPALRNDRKTLNKHLDLLADQSNLYDLYKTLSIEIFEHHDRMNHTDNKNIEQ